MWEKMWKDGLNWFKWVGYKSRCIWLIHTRQFRNSNTMKKDCK